MTPTACTPFGFLSFYTLCRHTRRGGDVQALPGTPDISVSRSPCSLTPVRPHAPRLFGALVLPATTRKVSALTFVLTRLYHTARLLPVLRLNLVLPLRLQGLGTCNECEWYGLRAVPIHMQFTPIGQDGWLFLFMSGSHRLYIKRLTGAHECEQNGNAVEFTCSSRQSIKGPLAVGGLPRHQGKAKNMQEYTKHKPTAI